MNNTNVTQIKPTVHLSTYTVETSDHFEHDEKLKDEFDETIHEYIHRILHCSNRSEAIHQRTNALKFIDQWRLRSLERLDRHVRTANQLVLAAFDQYQKKRDYVKCAYRLNQIVVPTHNKTSVFTSITTAKPSINAVSDLSSLNTNECTDEHEQIRNIKQNVEISIEKLNSSSSNDNKTSLNSIDFGRDFTFETLAHLSASSHNDTAMVLCENNILIYCQNSNELAIISLTNPKRTISTIKFGEDDIIRDLCYIKWLSKCLVMTNRNISLLDCQTKRYDIIHSNVDYLSGAVDNHRGIVYLMKRTTLHTYDKKSLLNFQSNHYPIGFGYVCRRMTLDNKMNNYLALLVQKLNEQNSILIYSTSSFNNGYLYKIIIDDHIERQWICSNGNHGWFVQGIHSGSCFDVNMNGLNCVRIFNCDEIQNIIPMDKHHQRLIVRTKTEIFVVIKRSFIESLS